MVLRFVLLEPTTPSVPTSYASALSSSSPIFSRPGDNDERRFYYQPIQVTVSTTGRYIFASTSELDTWGYFYQTTFDPSAPTVNLIADDDNGGAQRQFRIQVYLQSGSTYILVVTTRGEYASGNFLVSARGPASVVFLPFIASTSRPILTRKPLPITFPIIHRCTAARDSHSFVSLPHT